MAVLGALAILAAGGCDDLLTESPPHILVADNLYVDAAGFQAGLNGLYASVREEKHGMDGQNDIRTKAWSLGTDVAWGNGNETRVLGYDLWGPLMNPTFRDLGVNWPWLYRIVNSANTIIGRAENPQVKWTEADRNRIVGEARLFRAWAYRHLTYMFGDVPLNLEESSGEKIRTDWERTPVAQVREQMEKDLLFAEEHLPNVSPRSDRLNKAVARHYLSELYLAMGQPDRAEQKAEAVINSGDYRLVTSRYGIRASQPGVPFMDQFLDGNVNRHQGNTEVLWAFQYQQFVEGGAPRGNILRREWGNRYWQLPGLVISLEYGGRGIGRDAITKWSIDNYEPRDDRGSHFAIRKFYLFNNPATLPAGKALGDTIHLRWERERTSSWDWPQTRKWDWGDPNNLANSDAYNDVPYLRLAETYLLAAEAELKLGKVAEAAEHLNVVRRRSRASDVAPAQVTLDFILDERARELLTEEHRRYTLLRTGKWLERTRRFNPISAPHVAEHNVLFPIPQSVIDANLDRKMEQNPGY